MIPTFPNEKKNRLEKWFKDHDEEDKENLYKYAYEPDDEEEKDDDSPRSPFDRDGYEPDAWEKAQKEDEGMYR